MGFGQRFTRRLPPKTPPKVLTHTTHTTTSATPHANPHASPPKTPQKPRGQNHHYFLPISGAFIQLHFSKQQKQNHSANSRMERKNPPNRSGNTDRRADTTKDRAFVEKGKHSVYGTRDTFWDTLRPRKILRCNSLSAVSRLSQYFDGSHTCMNMKIF